MGDAWKRAPVVETRALDLQGRAAALVDLLLLTDALPPVEHRALETPASRNCVSAAEPSLVEKIVEVHRGLTRVGIDHAFGGALALAYYTDEPRATADIDLNVALPASDARRAFAALPDAVEWGPRPSRAW